MKRQCELRSPRLVCMHLFCAIVFVLPSAGIAEDSEPRSLPAPVVPDALLAISAERMSLDPFGVDIHTNYRHVASGRTRNISRRILLSGQRRRYEKSFPDASGTREIAIQHGDQLYCWKESKEDSAGRYPIETYNQLSSQNRDELSQFDKLPPDPRILGVVPTNLGQLSKFNHNYLRSIPGIASFSDLRTRADLPGRSVIATLNNAWSIAFDVQDSAIAQVTMSSPDQQFTVIVETLESQFTMEGVSYPKRLKIVRVVDGKPATEELHDITILSSPSDFADDQFSISSMDVPQGVLALNYSSGGADTKGAKMWNGKELVNRDVSSKLYPYARTPPNQISVWTMLGWLLLALGVVVVMVIIVRLRWHIA